MENIKILHSQLKTRRQQVESGGSNEVIGANHFHMGLFYIVYTSQNSSVNAHIPRGELNPVNSRYDQKTTPFMLIKTQ